MFEAVANLALLSMGEVMNMVKIDRTTLFNPVAFIGKDWSIVEEDERALALTEVDLNKVTFETMLRSGEVSVDGEEKIRRLKAAGHIRLDAKVFQTLWENQLLILESWKSKGNIYFDGTILHNSAVGRCVLCLCWCHGEWDWHYYWLDDDWYAQNLSVCLAS